MMPSDIQSNDIPPSRATRARARRELRAASSWLLTPTEEAVANCLLDGLSNSQIAAKLNVSYKAVDKHLVNVYSKMGVTSRLQAALRWQAFKLIQRPYHRG